MFCQSYHWGCPKFHLLLIVALLQKDPRLITITFYLITKTMSRKIKNIMLVDDDEVANYLHQMLLQELDSFDNIFIAFNGQEALSLLEANCQKATAQPHSCPDLIFLDLNMPGMDGFEFLDVMEKTTFPNRHVHIVIVTSSDNQRDIQRAQAYPIDGYISKPLTEEKIKHILNQI